MTTKTTDPFEAALAELLGPLAQAMVAYGVTIGTGTEALKKALLLAALEKSDDELSDSRASLLTGIHRKDVKRLRQATDEMPHRRATNAAALVISHWATDPDYQDQTGAPCDLPRKGSETTSGFDDVVRQSRVDMAPGTVLQALLDQGVVSELDDGTYRLLTHTFLPKAGSKEQVAAYQATLSAHLKAATHNLLADAQSDRHFDRAVRYTHLSAEAVNELRQTASAQAQALLQQINALARELQDRDPQQDQSGRFVLGVYILPSPPQQKDK